MDKATALNLLKNTFVPLELEGGVTVKLTLAFYLLKKLESKNPDLADRYYKATSKKQHEMREFDIVTMLYTAYVCANMDDPELMDEDTFMILLGSDRVSLKNIVQGLVGSKKKPGFANRS